MNNPENLTSVSDGLDILKLFEILKRRWRVIVISTILIAGIAYIVSSYQPVNYQAKATLLIQPAQSSTANEYDVILVASKLVFTYTEMLKGESVLEEVISKLKLDQTPDELVEKITIATIPDTQLIRLTVSDTSPTRAAKIANSLAEVFLEQTKALQAERYAGPLKAIQDKIDGLTKQTEETKTKIDALNNQKVDYDVEINRLEEQLKDYQDNFRLLHQNYQDIQLIIAQSSNIVHVMDKARIINSGGYPTSASVMLQINQLPSTGKDDYNALLLSERLASTYGLMLHSQSLLDAAIKQSGEKISAIDLAKRVKVEQVAGTQMINVSVWDPNGERAKKITDAIAQTFVVQIQTLQSKPYLDRQDALQKQMDELKVQIEQTRASVIKTTTVKVQVEQDLFRLNSLRDEYRNNYQTLLQDYDQLLLAEANSTDAALISEFAREPSIPVDRKIINTILAMMVGGMVGVGMAFLLEHMQDKIRTRQDVRKALGVFPITTITKLGDKRNNDQGDWSNGSRMAEEFRGLGTKLRLAGKDSSLRTILVTSPSQSEGKTFILANLAIALARAGMNVVAVDADLRFPQLHVAFGIQQDKGLADYLAENKNNDIDIKLTEAKGVQVLCSGETPENPVGLLSAPSFRKVLEELSNKADLVLIDCPPVLPVADATVLAENVDGVLLILRADQTDSRAARDAVESLTKVSARFIGVVLNAVSEARDSNSRYYSHSSKKTVLSAFDFKHAQNLIKALQKKS